MKKTQLDEGVLGGIKILGRAIAKDRGIRTISKIGTKAVSGAMNGSLIGAPAGYAALKTAKTAMDNVRSRPKTKSVAKPATPAKIKSGSSVPPRKNFGDLSVPGIKRKIATAKSTARTIGVKKYSNQLKAQGNPYVKEGVIGVLNGARKTVAPPRVRLKTKKMIINKESLDLDEGILGGTVRALGKLALRTTARAAKSGALGVEKKVLGAGRGLEKRLKTGVRATTNSLSKSRTAGRIGNTLSKAAVVGAGAGSAIAARRNIGTTPVRESSDIEEALSITQRRKRMMILKRNKSKLAIGRLKASHRVATMEVLKKRARRQARREMAKKLSKGVDKSELGAERKSQIEKRMATPAIASRINRLSKRLIKKARERELSKKRGSDNS